MSNALKCCSPKTKNTQKGSNMKLVQTAEDVDLTVQKKFHKEIAALSQPIFKFFNVNYFGHTKAFHNGQFSAVMTNPELTECFLKHKYPISFSEGRGFYLDAGFYISDCVKRNFGVEEKLKILWDEFHIGHLIHIIKKHVGYDEMYSFGLNVEDSTCVNKFLNHMQMIEHFILYFKSQTSGIFNKIEPVSYGKEYFLPAQNKLDIKNVTDREKEDFFKTQPIKKIQMLGKFGNVFLSQREYECLRYAGKCYSLKEIAKHMDISPRTVETYLNSLKDKLGVERRSELVMFDF